MSTEETGASTGTVQDGQEKLQRLTGLRDIMRSAIDNNRDEEVWNSSIALKNALEQAVSAANVEIDALKNHIESLG